jgi:pyruvate dehydrogenase E1 component beta subunit
MADVMTRTETISLIEASRLALTHALEDDPAVVLLGEDIADAQGGGIIKVTEGLSTRFGAGRVRSTPIAEQAIAGAAIGAAMSGLRPVAEIMMMNFITVAMDQLVNHAAKLRYMSGGRTGVPLTIRTIAGGGAQLGAQHSDTFEAWLAHVPGLKVVVPSTTTDAYGLLLSCIFDDDPCVFIETTLLYYGGGTGPAPERGQRVPIGKAAVVRPGRDLTIVGYGQTVPESLAAAERLAADGIDAEVVDLRTVSPLDRETLASSAARTRRVLVVHEAPGPFGVGAEVASVIHEEVHSDLLAPVRRLGSRPSPVPYAANLEALHRPGPASIEAAARQLAG